MKELHAAFAKALGKKTSAPPVSAKPSTCYACGGMVGKDGYAEGGEVVEEPESTPDADDAETKQSKAKGFLLALKGK